HEFHHNELFVLEATQKLARDTRGAVFYSPWQSEARPLYGILHALQTFCGIVRFYRIAEAAAGAKIDREEAHQRRIEICRKLRICRLQVPQQELAPLGKGFLESIDDELVRQNEEQQLSDKIPEDIR